MADGGEGTTRRVTLKTFVPSQHVFSRSGKASRGSPSAQKRPKNEEFASDTTRRRQAASPAHKPAVPECWRRLTACQVVTSLWLVSQCGTGGSADPRCCRSLCGRVRPCRHRSHKCRATPARAWAALGADCDLERREAGNNLAASRLPVGPLHGPINSTAGCNLGAVVSHSLGLPLPRPLSQASHADRRGVTPDGAPLSVWVKARCKAAGLRVNPQAGSMVQCRRKCTGAVPTPVVHRRCSVICFFCQVLVKHSYGLPSKLPAPEAMTYRCRLRCRSPRCR